MARLVLMVLTILVGSISYYVHDFLTKTNVVPEYDMEYRWGPDTKEYPDISIRPFTIEFSDVMIYDLKQRLKDRRALTPPLENAGFTYGFNTEYLTKVLDFWRDKYAFRQREHFLNKFKHFKTNIQGLDMHYLHAKPKVGKNFKVLPILMLHGWPGSIREFYEVIPMLLQKTPGYNFVFEVIAPSLPGYGYSQGAVKPGLGAQETAVVMRNLMHRIGFDKYYVQGGDWGHVIGSSMATLFPSEVLGFHTNMPVLSAHPVYGVWWLLGCLWPSLVVEKEMIDRMYPLTKHLSQTVEETGYFHLQATKPDTVGVALTDSPAGLAAYILEKFSTWTNPSNKQAGDGNLSRKYSLTTLLDNVMIYWDSNSITTSMRMYANTVNKKLLAVNLDTVPTKVPTWGIKFKHELMFNPDSFLRKKFLNYLHSSVIKEGGHFAALEFPEIIAEDIFEAVTAFQTFNAQHSTK